MCRCSVAADLVSARASNHWATSAQLNELPVLQAPFGVRLALTFGIKTESSLVTLTKVGNSQSLPLLSLQCLSVNDSQSTCVLLGVLVLTDSTAQAWPYFQWQRHLDMLFLDICISVAQDNSWHVAGNLERTGEKAHLEQPRTSG